MAQTLVALIVWLCLAFPPAAAPVKDDTSKPAQGGLTVFLVSPFLWAEAAGNARHSQTINATSV